MRADGLAFVDDAAFVDDTACLDECLARRDLGHAAREEAHQPIFWGFWGLGCRWPCAWRYGRQELLTVVWPRCVPVSRD